MTTGRKLAIACVLVTGIMGYMAYLGAAASWQYYLTVDECLASGSTLAGSRVRVSGKVASQSLQIAADHRQATFALQGAAEQLRVRCSGSLPDNLAEDMEVVVEGRVDDSGTLHGDRVLTRCASKYKSKPSSAPEGNARARAERGP